MPSLLQARRGSAASDPRDMVFAHVGFATDTKCSDIRVDYSKITVEVFTDCARYLAKKNGFITIAACISDGVTSSELSVRKVLNNIRQIAPRIAGMDIAFDEIGTLMFDQSILNSVEELYNAVYQMWREMVQDDDILPPNSTPQHDTPCRYSYDTAISFLIPLGFNLVSNGGASSRCFDEMALARLINGRLALVPTSAQGGDMVAWQAIPDLG
ncbi:hypothetical protein AOQ84DRAFT_371366 [Glonium stellatum]|uniref:Uncharacterized protein n=1 Tax=Glonium stellatum TaxID=574774 RepID=A0A8E2FBW5_9PEZI|nr:hypothetical protein AOQ84DRAFT_371366 [Glonium stellatum]